MNGNRGDWFDRVVKVDQAFKNVLVLIVATVIGISFLVLAFSFASIRCDEMNVRTHKDAYGRECLLYRGDLYLRLPQPREENGHGKGP